MTSAPRNAPSSALPTETEMNRKPLPRRSQYINDWSVIMSGHAVSIETPKSQARSSSPQGPGRRPAGPAQDARPQEILAAAFAVFAERGFAAAAWTHRGPGARLQRQIYLYSRARRRCPRAHPGDLAKRVSDLAAFVRDIAGRCAPAPRVALRLGHMVRRAISWCCQDGHRRSGQLPRSRAYLPRGSRERGLTLFGGLLQSGMERGESARCRCSMGAAVHCPASARSDLAHHIRALDSRVRLCGLSKRSLDLCADCREERAHETKPPRRPACVSRCGVHARGKYALARLCEGKAVLVAPPQPGWITSLNVTRGRR